MAVKMFGLRCRLRVAPARALVLEQLVDVANYAAASLELLEVAGEGGVEDATAVLERLAAVHANVVAARTALKGASSHRLFPFHAVDPKVRGKEGKEGEEGEAEGRETVDRRT